MKTFKDFLNESQLNEGRLSKQTRYDSYVSTDMNQMYALTMNTTSGLSNHLNKISDKLSDGILQSILKLSKDEKDGLIPEGTVDKITKEIASYSDKNFSKFYSDIEKTEKEFVNTIVKLYTVANDDLSKYYSKLIKDASK